MLLLKTVDPVIRSFKMFSAQPCSNVLRLFPQQWATDYCIAASSLFKPCDQQTLQFLKCWLFQAPPLTREPATLHNPLQCLFLLLPVVFNCDATICNMAASTTCVSLLASTWAGIFPWIEDSFLFFDLWVSGPPKYNIALRWHRQS